MRPSIWEPRYLNWGTRSTRTELRDKERVERGAEREGKSICHLVLLGLMVRPKQVLNSATMLTKY